MKKSNLIGSLVLLVFLVAAAAIAGQVFGRATATLGTTTGTCTWTNSMPYAALALKRIWIQNSLSTNSTVTINRISTIDSASYTDACATVVLSTTSTNTATFTAGYLGYGDRLYFSGSGTGATAVIEYEVQKH